MIFKLFLFFWKTVKSITNYSVMLLIKFIDGRDPDLSSFSLNLEYYI